MPTRRTFISVRYYKSAFCLRVPFLSLSPSFSSSRKCILGVTGGAGGVPEGVTQSLCTLRQLNDDPHSDGSIAKLVCPDCPQKPRVAAITKTPPCVEVYYFSTAFTITINIKEEKCTFPDEYVR